MRRLLIVGAGGHGGSVAECAAASGNYDVVGYLGDAAPAGTRLHGLPVLGSSANLIAFRHLADVAIVAIGNNTVREALCIRVLAAGFALATLIHPRAIASPSAVIGQGAAIMAGAVVGTEAQVGKGAIVNSGAIVDHHAQVLDYGHLGVNACMAGGSILGRSAWMQAGTALGYGVKVPYGAVLLPGTALA